MKGLFLAAAFLGVSLATANARLGETVAQIQIRYGQPTNLVSAVTPDDDAPPTFSPATVKEIKEGNYGAHYKKDEFEIYVTFRNGVSNGELYSKVDRSDISEAETSHLLAINQGKSEWAISERMSEVLHREFWKRQDGAAMAAFIPGGRKMFMISTTSEANSANDTAKKLKDF